MSVGTQQGVVDAIRFDLRKFHETWMELLFPRQRSADDTVLGKWKPDTPREKVTYNGWYALGVLVVGILYPLALAGVIVRFHARRIDTSVARLGALGVVLLAVVVWGGLAALVKFQFDFPANEANAVIAASIVAIVSSALAMGFRALDGRPVTVLFAYPFAMTAIFLPPVVAALLSNQVADFVLPYSEQVATFIQDEVLVELGLTDLRAWLIENFNRRGADSGQPIGLAYVFIWLGISIPVGWLLGIMVTLADFIRPTGE